MALCESWRVNKKIPVDTDLVGKLLMIRYKFKTIQAYKI